MNEEALLVLIGLVVLAIPVCIIVLLVGHARLRRRVNELERQVGVLQPHAPAAEADPAAPAEQPEPAPAIAAEPARAGPWSAGRRISPKDSPEQPQDPAGPAGSPPRAVVFRRDRFAALGIWLRENWFYAVSAMSLALAGIFLVQYGVENGLLPPTARVACALGFGVTLIAAGEYIRRRFGDDEAATTAYLPSVFSGAGLITLFGAILAARQLYDLISPETALAGMMAVALVGLVLGWFHGPLLAAIGLTGAFGAPFVVGGSSEDPSWLFGYFLVVALLGLGIDTVRRWAWISVLTLIGAYGCGALLALSSGSPEPELVLYATALALAAIIIPARRLVPDHGGAMMSEMVLRRKGDPWPEFPTRLAFGAMVASVGAIGWSPVATAGEFWLAVLLLWGLVLALILWARGARALQDVTLLPALGLLGLVWREAMERGPVYTRFLNAYAESPEADFPRQVTMLVAMGVILSLAASWRSFQSRELKPVWAGAAAVFAPALAILLELGWMPTQVIGAYPWALHALALGIFMVVLAERFARADGEQRLRAALATLSALSCLAFACVIVLSSAALTVALAVTVLAAAALDRQFRLPPMTLFIAVGVVTLGYRLVVDPGLRWAENAPLAEVILAYGGTLAGFVAALWLLRPLDRPVARVMLDSAAWSTGGLFLSILLFRWLETVGEGGSQTSHWGLGLTAVIWIGLAFAQVQRLELGGRMAWIRVGLAAVFGLIGLAALRAALMEGNPLLNSLADPVLGPPVINSLAVAYLLPAAAIALAVWRIPGMPARLRLVCAPAALALAALWLGLVIRHVWQGPERMYSGHGVTQPELYTYTLALLIIGALLFYQSLARHSHLMRKAGLAVIGVAVAKVFLIDIAGLGGLIRVFSLLALGLALAGLAWLNRWAQQRHAPQGADGSEPEG